MDQKLEESLKSSPCFSVLADECEDITTAEELSICCRWIVNGRPEEHFRTVLHISALDAATILQAICSFLESKNLDYHKLAKGMMVQPPLLESTMEFKRGFEPALPMPSTFIVRAIDFN